MQEDNGHRIHHRVQLPGGRHIEVVYLNRGRRAGEPSPSVPPAPLAPETAQQPTPVSSTPWPEEQSRQPGGSQSDTRVAPTPWTGDSPSRAPGEALHVCPRCTGKLAHPLDWLEESPGRWRVLIRCPDCDLLREGVFGQALVERLDDELDKATAALLSDLKRVTHANMVEEIERFSRALELDLIGPSDF